MPLLMVEMTGYECFLSFIQQSSSCAASPWSSKAHNWIDQIPSALKFLAGSGKGDIKETRKAYFRGI